MVECHASESPDAILQGARSFLEKNEQMGSVKAESSVALRLAEAAYDDFKGRPDDAAKQITEARKETSNVAGWVDGDVSRELTLSINLAEVNHLDVVGDHNGAEQKLVEIENDANRKRYRYEQSRDGEEQSRTIVGIGRADHFDAEGEPELAKQTLADTMQKLKNHESNFADPSWSILTSSEIAVGTAQYRLAEKYGDTAGASSALASIHQLAQRDYTLDRGKAALAVRSQALTHVLDAEHMYKNGNCAATESTLQAELLRVDSLPYDKRVHHGDMMAKIHSGVAIEKLRLQTGLVMAPSSQLIFTDSAMNEGRYVD